MTKIQIIIAGLSTVLLAGCSASLDSHRVIIPIKPGVNIAGLVVNQNSPHQVIAVFRDNPNSTRIVTKAVRVLLPAPDEAYVLGYTGGLFFSRGLSVELFPDGSVKQVKLNSENQVPKALEEINKSAQAFVTMREEVKQAKDKEKTDPTEADNLRLKKEILNLMLKANKEAIKKGDPLPYTDVGL